MKFITGAFSSASITLRSSKLRSSKLRSKMVLMKLTDAHLLEAAAQFETPLYAYDLATLKRQLERVKNAFRGARLFYAMKANPNLTLLGHIRAAGFGFECVSRGELERCIYLGCSGEDILVNGPAKSAGEYARGAELGATFIVDRPGELERLPPVSRILIRVNPALEVSTHDHLATGAAHSKFGVTLEDVPHTLTRARELGHRVRGLHLHIGSAIRDATDFSLAFEKIAALAQTTGPLEVLDCGGGWGLDATLEDIAEVATRAAAAFGAQLWVEPGRFLVAECGVLLSRVVGFKKTARNFALVDAGMTELIRPMLYGAEHPVRVLSSSSASTQTYDLAGPACESGDVLARGVNLPTLAEGDLIALEQAGAYSSAMSSHYLTRPHPVEVLWDGQKWQTIRAREQVEDLWRLELPKLQQERERPKPVDDVDVQASS